MKKLIAVLIMSLLMALLVTTPAFAGGNSHHMHSHQDMRHQNHNNHQHMHQGHHNNQNNQVQVQLYSVGNSGVSGFVHLSQRGNMDRAHIVVNAFGLTPGKQYVSLYYDNHTCELEPYSSEDVIGGIYTANHGGVGATQGNADDPLSEINSVSVRQAGDFKLLACANVHP
jgi:Ni/Co efflux regulator RcnB